MTHPARGELGARLRACRRAAQLTGKDLAALLGITQGTVSKIENGHSRAEPDLVRRWLEHCHADEATIAALTEMAKATAELTEWSRLHARGWQEHQRSYADLERSAGRILVFQAALVPGLFQTVRYTSYLLEQVVGLTPEEAAKAAAARATRQALLYEPGVSVRAILTEGVLRHRLGGRSIMAEQLHRLAEISRLPTVELGIIPADTDMPSRYGVSFDLYDKLDGTDDALAIVELETEELRVYQREQVEAYRRRHDIYWSASITGERATSWLYDAAKELMRRDAEREA